MFKGYGLAALVGVLVLTSLLVIFLEWRAVHSIHKGLGHGSGVQAILEKLPAGLRARGRKDRDSVSDSADESKKAGLRGAADDGAPASEFPVPPEVRHKKCIDRTFDVAKLPKVSLVIPYLHETWEQMHATVASILAYSPQEILDKILFVDDSNSEEWEHHADLEGLHPKIKVHRNEERQGLIRSKVIGASMVSSDVIVFMEPHCVVGRHWLEPLLERLATSADHSTLVMPGIDIIPEEDFNGYKVANHHIGGFDWSLTFNWMALIEERNKSYTYPDPYPTPALSGGIFGIWKDYWDRMGTYDVNMTEWGGEHIEMSLRMWRCGARLEIVPCSRLGHVFRARNPYVVHPPLVIRNLKRAALVWLDERLEDFYSSVPAARNMDAGDVEERRRLKESLGCKSMTWYVENVYPELNAEQPRRR